MAQEIGSEKPVIFSACGIEDYTRELNRRFVSCMKDLGFEFIYEEWPGTHDFNFWDESLKRALEKIFK